MRIEWNRVTWYSKAIALGVFIALIIGAFWFGFGAGVLIASVVALAPAPAKVAPVTAAVTAGSEYYSNVAEWQTNTPYSTVSGNGNAGSFSIAAPIDFAISDNVVAPSPNWRQNSPEANAGLLYLTLTIPKAFEPQTNFDEATLTVGSSKSGTAIADCLVADPSGGATEPSSTVILNGTSFTVFKASDAGAGNLYETTSYRTVHAGQCYAVEYTIHSSQIANYPASYNLHPFDQKMLTDLLDKIVGTFKFE